MALHLYHATTWEAAHAIEQTQFRPGKRGYAGAGIYFSADPLNALRHCFNGDTGKAEVMISCSVDLGACLSAKRNTVDKDVCFAKGYDSVWIKGTDTYAVYESWRISVTEFRWLADGVCWYPSATTSADPSAAPVEIMISAVQASSNGCFNASTKAAELYAKYPSLRKAVRAAGGLKSFCEAHPELAMDGHFVTVAQATPLFQQQEIRREEEARQIHATVRRQAEEERHQMRLQIEMQFEQEVARLLKVQKEEAARLHEAAQKRETLQQKQVQKEKIEKRQAAQELHMKKVQLERDQEASQRQQLQMKHAEAFRQKLLLKREEAARQMLMLMRQEGPAHTQTQQDLNLSQQHQAPRWKQEEKVRQQMQKAKQQRQWLECAQDAQQQQELQLKEVSPWGAFVSIISAGISAAFRCLLEKQ